MYSRNEMYVALGSVFRNAKGAQIIRAKRLIIHPQYLKTDRHDIAVVQLRRAAKLGRNQNSGLPRQRSLLFSRTKRETDQVTPEQQRIAPEFHCLLNGFRNYRR